MEIKTVVLRTPPGVTEEQMLTPAIKDSAAIDLYANWDGELPCIHLWNGMTSKIATGLKIGLPLGFGALVLPRSGLAVNHQVAPANSPGLIDPGFIGEIQVGLSNRSSQRYTIQRGDRIAQLLILPVAHPRFVRVDALNESTRGEQGFGSSGR